MIWFTADHHWEHENIMKWIAGILLRFLCLPF